MKRKIVCLALIIILSQSSGLPAETDLNVNAKVRAPAVAGQFYPADPSELAKIVKSYLEHAVKPSGKRPVAIISPHAGYVYSGQIAANAFNEAASHTYDLIILLGTNHTTFGFTGVSVYPGNYKTPLGIIETDKDIAKQLTDAEKDFVSDESVHAREHSIEVQVPFVQTLFPNVKVVAAVIGTPNLELCTRFGNVLANVVKNRQVLIVASSDLSHYPNYEDANRVDKKTLDAILTLDPKIVSTTIKKQETGNIKNLSTCACGLAPIMTAMITAKQLGANSARLISYANSGDSPVGSRYRVVGYGAVCFF
ncbi:AmmeMemoRadiSam system protein B [Desulfonema magnum]|uniref:AmmeMemoRadiSam system protein B n=1 Tax=Desulfonema magnum TaxID=45655 RepID=UPI001A9BBCA5|nr:AmmeMemoRadiSam system protein B [Desulfonema magnum]